VCVCSVTVLEIWNRDKKREQCTRVAAVYVGFCDSGSDGDH
jgi:hypothetical protein